MIANTDDIAWGNTRRDYAARFEAGVIVLLGDYAPLGGELR